MNSNFDISEQDLDRIIEAALESGGDWADLYFENTIMGNITLRDGAVAEGGYHTDYGVGIRVLKGERTGYAYSETTEMPSMLRAARTAGAIALNSSDYTLPHRMVICPPHTPYYPVGAFWNGIAIEKFVPVLRRIEEIVRAKTSGIGGGITLDKVIARLSFSQSDILMYNKFHCLAEDSRPMGSLSVNAIFNKGKQTLTESASRSFRDGPDTFMEEKLLQDLASDVVEGIEDHFEAVRPQGGQMSVVMGAGASGVLLHEAMGHAFEADFVRKGTSIFAGKIGKQICPKGINIVDSGLVLANRGSSTYDDEGNPTMETHLVEDGVLESYMHDVMSSAYFSVPPTGNGRRENFRFKPMPRMTTTYMESGDADPLDIIRSVNKGIYVDQFSNGEVKIGEGDFTFYVKSGYLIEDGHLTRPIKDINVMGNGPKALQDISMVGNDLKIDNGQWVCGKEQDVPVGLGIPTVLVKSLIVGGE